MVIHLPAITEILNYTIVNWNATLAAEPVTVGERREWLGRFSGPIIIGPEDLNAKIDQALKIAALLDSPAPG